MTRFVFGQLVILIILCAGSASAQVRTWVSGSGIDNGTCDRANPCRTFTAAISAVGTGGEVVVLDSAGYGPFTIDKAVSVIAPAGIFAGISPTTGTAIVIANTLSNARIVLRGLTLNGFGASNGIQHGVPPEPAGDSGNRLYIDDLTVSGFTGRGIEVKRTAEITILDTVVRDNVGVGIGISGSVGSPSRGMIHRTVLSKNLHGLIVWNGDVSVRDSVATMNSNVGFLAFYGVIDGNIARLSIDHSTSSNNGDGFYASVAGTMMLSNCVASFNTGHGAFAHNGGTLRLAHTTLTGNGVGLEEGSGLVESLGDNNIRGNGMNVSGTIDTYLPR